MVGGVDRKKEKAGRLADGTLVNVVDSRRQREKKDGVFVWMLL
jgi:hypothetical protein